MMGYNLTAKAAHVHAAQHLSKDHVGRADQRQSSKPPSSSTLMQIWYRFGLQPFGLPMGIMLFLSLVLLFYAGLLLLPSQPSMPEAPVFQSYREEDGRLFLDDRLVRAPILYGWLHAVPGSLWCIGIPLQHSKRIRQRFPSVHRWSGRLTIMCSFTLAVTGMIFSPRKLAYSAPTFHLHSLQLGAGPRPVTVLVWPTFDALLWWIGPLLGLSAYKTVTLARAKDFVSHKRWAMACTMVGYVVPLQRVGILFVEIVAAVLPHLTADQRAFLRCPEDVVGKAQAEKAAFALTGWGALAVICAYAMLVSNPQNNVGRMASADKLTK